MDSNEFVEKAPDYYALGIAIALAQRPDARTMQLVESEFAAGELYIYFQKELLVVEASKILARHGVITLVADVFGPTIFRAERHLSDWLVSGTNPIPLFRKYNEVADLDWVRRAIRSVNETYNSLAIEPSDFAQDGIEIQWEPIPLDRSDGTLKRLTEDVQKAITSIEQDNGYAANAPLRLGPYFPAAFRSAALMRSCQPAPSCWK
jgi:hypothetical protein